MQEVESEWVNLKGLVKQCANGITGHTFSWWSNPDCLQLDYVAATFLDGHRVVFDQRPQTPGGIFPDSPLPREEWPLEARATGSSVMWSPQIVPKPHGDFSSNELAEKIVERLIQYQKDYTKACTP